MSAIQLHTHLRLKQLQKADGGRWLIGTATTPTTDRMGDIVDPRGAEYELPLILLFAHNHDRPIGSVIEASASHDRITVKARLAEGTRDSDEVWTLLQEGVPLALSIGFQSLAHEPLPGGGLRFTRWAWHELSIVSVPANPEARLRVGKGIVCTASQEKAAPAVSKAASTAARSVPFDPEQFGQAVGQAIRERTAQLEARISALEARR